MGKRSDDFDIAIAGGGPAGCAASIGLARLGYRVALINRPRRQQAFEGFSQRTLEGLKAAGCTRALTVIGAEVRRQTSWAGVAAEANTEFLVARDAFDAALIADASETGVAVIAGRVDKVSGDAGQWQLHGTDMRSQKLTVKATFFVEARGRAAPATGTRRGPPTTALCRLWTVPNSAPAMTAVAPFRGGWAWFAASGDSQAILQLMVGSDRGRLPSRDLLTEHYMTLLQTIAECSDWLAGAQATSRTFARGATPIAASPVLGGNWLRVGDAAFAIDPLSGHGVFVALGGALAAVPVINTLIRRPDDAAAAYRLYTERAEEEFLRCCRIGRDFYRQERRWPQSPFWRNRWDWPDDKPAHDAPFSAPPKIASLPVIEDGFICERAVIVTPDHPRGVWQVAGVPLVDLLRLIEANGPAAPEVLRQTAAQALDRSPEAIGAALGWLHTRRLIG